MGTVCAQLATKARTVQRVRAINKGGGVIQGSSCVRGNVSVSLQTRARSRLTDVNWLIMAESCAE